MLKILESVRDFEGRSVGEGNRKILLPRNNFFSLLVTDGHVVDEVYFLSEFLKIY